MKGKVVFQLQFARDSFRQHGCGNHATNGQRTVAPVKKRKSMNQGSATRVGFTPEEDDPLIQLKQQGCHRRKLRGGL
jgi:hypothetical protein